MSVEKHPVIIAGAGPVGAGGASAVVSAGTVTIGAGAAGAAGLVGWTPGAAVASGRGLIVQDGAAAELASAARVPAGVSDPPASAIPAAAVPSTTTVHRSTASGVDRRIPHGTTGRPITCRTPRR